MTGDMTFGPDDLSVADILRAPDSSRSDIEAVARYIETLESAICKMIPHPRVAAELRTSSEFSREEAEAIRILMHRVTRGGL